MAERTGRSLAPIRRNRRLAARELRRIEASPDHRSDPRPRSPNAARGTGDSGGLTATGALSTMPNTRRPRARFGHRRHQPRRLRLHTPRGEPSLRARAGAPGPGEGKRGLTKYIFVTGGVVSSLGKGLASASIGALLEGHGFTVAMMKCDPYINVDPGTMSPYQHGEVYVTGRRQPRPISTSGHYERFTHSPDLSRDSNVTTGQIYKLGDRQGAPRRLPGPTVQVIPHITDEIKHRRARGRGDRRRDRGDRGDGR